jgi:predicted phosphodiesterase
MALVADIHHGQDHGTKLGTAALPLLGRFRDFVAQAAPDLVVELGDRINDVDAETDLRLTREVAAAFRGINVRRAHVLGNHDNHAIDRRAAEGAMGVSFESWSLDANGFHVVLWNAATSLAGGGGFRFAPEDLAWLERDLAATGLPAIVCTHVPLDGGSMVGNYYFEDAPAGCASYHDGTAARAVIEASGKVVLCLAGHTHWNARHTIDGVHYVTIHSLTESFTTPGRPCGAFGLLDIGEVITVEVFGHDPILHRLPLRRPGEHWVKPIRRAPAVVEPARVLESPELPPRGKASGPPRF